MNISSDEKSQANELIKKFLENKSLFSYVNLGVDDEYIGWVKNFHLQDKNKTNINLDLRKENDLFLVFVLAIVWSRTGQWENSAYFVAYLKTHKKDKVQFWIDESGYIMEQNIRKKSAEDVFQQLTYSIKPRRKISFRKDIFQSIHLLAIHWKDIRDTLRKSEKQNDFRIFMDYMRGIEGLGVGKRKMLIKIPLILRELRCQKIFSNIPGEFCCVPDARVYKAAKDLKINLPHLVDLKSLIESSSKIYGLFGDLYDIPLFAFNELM